MAMGAVLFLCWGTLSAQGLPDWSLDVRVLTSVGLGRPDVGEGAGWRGQAMQSTNGPLFSRWGFQATRSFGGVDTKKIGRGRAIGFWTGTDAPHLETRMRLDARIGFGACPVDRSRLDCGVLLVSHSVPD